MRHPAYVARGAPLVCTAVLLSLNICSRGFSQTKARASPSVVEQVEREEQDTEHLQIWRPANRITGEEAGYMICSLFGICAAAFLAFAFFLFLFRETPKRSIKPMPKLSKKEPPVDLDI